MRNIVDFARRNMSVISFAFASAALTTIANRSGVGWSWDTSDYVAVGKNFANGKGLLDATGIPMTVRPPGISFLIATGDLLGASVNSTMRVLNFFCAAIVVIATHQLLQIAQVSKTVRLITTAFIAFSPALLWQYSMIWSEPPFIALVVISMLVGLQKANVNKFVTLILLFAALFFVRYVGPVFAFSIAVASTLYDRHQLKLTKSVFVNFGAFAISLIPVWFWLQRNKSLDGTLTGARTPGGGNLFGPLKTFTGTIGSWVTASPVEGGIFLSWNDHPTTTKFFGVGAVVALIALLAGYTISQRRRTKVIGTSSIFTISLSILIFYIIFSTYRFVYFEFGPLDNRMMIPIYVPLVLITAVAVGDIQINSKTLRRGFTGLFILLVVFQAVSSFNDALKFGRDGRYWATSAFINQPIHQTVVELPTDSALMSNQPQQLFAVWQNSSVLNQYQLELAQNTECENRYFVWYNSNYDDGTPNLEGQPEGAIVLYTDTLGSIFDLGPCNSNVTKYWP